MAEGFKSDIPPAINSTAKKYIRGMMKGKSRWAKLYGNRDKEVMHKTANKMAMGEMQKMPPTYSDVFGGISEKAVSKKQQRFFGMVRAAQKGEMENPSPEVAKVAATASMSDVKKFAKTKHKNLPMKKKVEEANKSGDSSLRDWFSKSRSSDGKPGWVQLGGKYAGKPCARQPGQTTKPKCGSSKMKRNLDKGEEEAAFRRKQKEDPNPNRKGKAINVRTEATINERGDYWHPDPDKDRKLGGPGANQRAREDRAAASKPKEDPKKLRKGESYMDYAKRQGKKSAPVSKPKERKRDKIGKALGRAIDRIGGIKKEEVEVQEGMGDVAIKAIRATQGKDPKYLSKRSEMIRRIKMKQLNTYLKKRDDKKKERVTNVGVGEEVQMEGKKDACYHKVKSRYSVWPSAYASGALVKCRKKGAKNWGNKSKKEEFEGNLGFQDFQEKAKACWDTHKKVGMKMKGGKLVNDCRPKNEETTNEAKKCWPGYEKKGTQKLFGKTYNRCVKKEETQNESAAWTRKAGKAKSGGLNEKGRKSYERENPGSDLKAPSKKVGNPRRASFCARMKGMKAKLTSKKTASDPDSRINKSLRAWNC